MRILPVCLLLLAGCSTSRPDASAVKLEVSATPARPSPTLRVVRLRYADAGDMSRIVQELFPAPEWDEGEYVPGVRVVADPRSNSLVLSVDAEKLDEVPHVAQLIEQLDVEIKPTN